MTKTLADEAAALLREARVSQTKDCRVRRSPNAALIEALLAVGGNPAEVSRIIAQKHKETVSETVIRFHRQKRCLCYRDRYHGSGAAPRD